MKDPYKTLKVNRSALLDEIKAAYRKLSMRWHPDRNIGDSKAADRFKEVQAAWELLSDPERRARFDATGDTSEQKEAPILSVVGAILSAVISEVSGRYMDLTKTDLVGLMTQKLAKNREQMKGVRLQRQKHKNELQVMVVRFIRLDGRDNEDNPLRRMVEQHLADAEVSLQQVESDLSLCEQTIQYLKQFGYKIDTRQGPGIHTLTSMGLAHLTFIEKKDGHY